MRSETARGCEGELLAQRAQSPDAGQKGFQRFESWDVGYSDWVGVGYVVLKYIWLPDRTPQAWDQVNQSISFVNGLLAATALELGLTLEIGKGSGFGA